MTAIINADQHENLLVVIRDAAKRTTRARGKRSLIAFTCYVDEEAVLTLVDTIRGSLQEQNARLVGVQLFFDAGEWAKQRIDERALRENIARHAGLAGNSVTIAPAWFSGRLFHAKCYALVGRNRYREARGFVVMTSGNLTRRGLGLDEHSNVELAHVLTAPDELERIEKLADLLSEEHAPPDAFDERQHEVLMALSLFSRGTFYHVWQDELASATRFSLKLTPKGREALAGRDNPFPEYARDSQSISRDPIKLSALLNSVGPVVPRRFWANFSIDTTLGRWIPRGVDDAVEAVMQKKLGPYQRKILTVTAGEKLSRISASLDAEVEELRSKGYVRAKDDVVKRWRARVEDLRNDPRRIQLNVLRYERLEDVLDTSRRSALRQLLRGVQDHVDAVPKPRGLKRIMKQSLALDGSVYDKASWQALDEQLAALAHKARDALESS